MSVAIQLARLRAQHAAPLKGDDVDRVAHAAATLGRRLIEVRQPDGTRAFVIGWTDGHEPAVSDGAVVLRRLSPLPTLTFACCLGLCWPDPQQPVYPGIATTPSKVINAATKLGADERHVKGALRNELQAAGLVQLCGDELRLGAAVAAWAAGQIDTLRRFHHSLPTVGDKPG